MDKKVTNKKWIYPHCYKEKRKTVNEDSTVQWGFAIRADFVCWTYNKAAVTAGDRLKIAQRSAAGDAARFANFIGSVAIFAYQAAQFFGKLVS